MSVTVTGPTFRIRTDDISCETYIDCLRCGERSFNRGDIANLYCAKCKQFHDQDLAPGITMRPVYEANRSSPFYKRIVGKSWIIGTLTGYTVTLECGHSLMIFGNLDSANWLAYCTECEEATSSVAD